MGARPSNKHALFNQPNSKPLFNVEEVDSVDEATCPELVGGSGHHAEAAGELVLQCHLQNWFLRGFVSVLHLRLERSSARNVLLNAHLDLQIAVASELALARREQTVVHFV